MEFPILLYKRGGPHKCKGGTYGYVQVHTVEEIKPLWHVGYRGSILEAQNAENSDDPTSFLDQFQPTEKESSNAEEVKHVSAEEGRQEDDTEGEEGEEGVQVEPKPKPKPKPKKSTKKTTKKTKKTTKKK